jgi:hypothetical protein
MTCGGGKRYVAAVALKVRVTATHGPKRAGPVPPLVYRAEAYDEHDQFREPKWSCDHEHRSVEHALSCGHTWLQESEESRVT